MTWSGAELLQSRRELTTKVGNNLGLSLYAVPQSAVVCVVTYFRRTELLLNCCQEFRRGVVY